MINTSHKVRGHLLCRRSWHPSPGNALCGSDHPLQSFDREGGAAASQDTLDGAPAEVGKYLGVHAAPPQPPQEEEPLSSSLCAHTYVCGVSRSDLLNQESESADLLHCSFLDVGGWPPAPSLQPPVVHDQLLRRWLGTCR